MLCISKRYTQCIASIVVTTYALTCHHATSFSHSQNSFVLEATSTKHKRYRRHVISTAPLFSQEDNIQQTDQTTNSFDSPSMDPLVMDFAKDLYKLSLLRPAIPNADFSAPIALISAGSSYTRLWNTDTWKRHAARYPHERYFRHVWRWRRSTTAQKVCWSSLLAASWAFILSNVLQTSYATKYMASSTKGVTAALGLLSAPLALLLTLRANAALARLNEARLAWGRLVLYVREVAALLRTYIYPMHPPAAVLAARYLSIFGWCLKSFVRGEEKEKEREVIEAMLVTSDDAEKTNQKEVEWLLAHPKSICGIPLRLRQIVAQVLEVASYSKQGQLQPFLVQHGQLLTGIQNVEATAGACERLLSSPIPPTYSRHLSRVITIWVALLPIGLIGSGINVLGTVIGTAFTSYVMIGLDEIGVEIESAFPMMPLQQLAGAAQRGVGMQFLDNECCCFTNDNDDNDDESNGNNNVEETLSLQPPMPGLPPL